jgi:hypothetical protein
MSTRLNKALCALFARPSHARRRFVGVLLITIIVYSVAVGGLYCAVKSLGNALPHFSDIMDDAGDGLAFSPEAWRTHVDARGRMADDLMARGLIKRITREDLVLLLGNPDSIDVARQRVQLCWWLGKRFQTDSSPNPEGEWLIVELDAGGRAIGAFYQTAGRYDKP